jgi:hypothetical protein
LGSGCAVLDVEPVQFRGAAHGLVVGRGPPVRGDDQPARFHRLQPGQCLAQFVSLAVVADDRDRIDPADAEGGEVVDHGAQRTWIRPHPRDLVGGEAGLDRRLVEVGVDVEVAVEEQIAE